ncbi:MAG: cox cluster protein [Halorientalis sp.]
MTDDDTTPGNRVVLTVYLTVVIIAGVMGTILGAIRPKDLDPELFGVIQLPATPFGVALFGMLTVGIGLGAFITVMIFVSRRFDDAAVK